LFWNIGTLISFRVSSEDASYIAKHFDPFLEWYDLANLGQREFYCKLLVEWNVKDPFSLKSIYVPDIEVPSDHVEQLYNESRSRYAHSILQARKIIISEQKDVVEVIENFSEPII
jgi:hypothetical protein